MAAVSTPLQLFPAPASTKASSPKRRGTRRYPVKPASPEAVVMRSEPKAPITEEIILHVSSDAGSSPIKAPAKSHIVDQPLRSATPAGARSHARTPSPTSAISRDRAISPTQLSEISGGTTLVRSNSDATPCASAPLRSMFPRYDPAVPLQHQQYYPAGMTPTNLGRHHMAKSSYSITASPPTSPGFYGAGPSTAPANMTEFPKEVKTRRKRAFSTTHELRDLWEAANGQATPDMGKTFVLRMHRAGTVDPASGGFTPTQSEAFSFGPSRTTPFFDFQTLKESNFDDNYSEVIVRRHDPTKNSVIPVITLDLEPPARRLPPQDGLITLIYPKVAAMMALEDTASKVKNHRVNPADAEALAKAAVRRAAERECCKLLWDAEKSRYYLWHPGLNRGQGQAFYVRMEGEIGFDVVSARGALQLVNSDNNDVLCSLEFGTESLLVDTAAMAKVSSFYIVDVAVTALFTVALVEGRRRRTHRFSAPPSMGVRLPDTIPTRQGTKRKGGKKEVEEELPKSATGVLTLVFIAYQAVVWALGMGVAAISAVVLGVVAVCGGKKA